MPARYMFFSVDLGQLTFGVTVVDDAARDANALVICLDGLVVGKRSGGFDQPAVRADEVFETSTPWETGF